MEDLLQRPRALLAIEALARSEPMTMREFTHATGHAHQHAQSIRDDLHEMGVLQVERRSGHGNAGILDIRLTEKGKQIAKHLQAVREIVAGRTPRRI